MGEKKKEIFITALVVLAVGGYIWHQFTAQIDWIGRLMVCTDLETKNIAIAGDVEIGLRRDGKLVWRRPK